MKNFKTKFILVVWMLMIATVIYGVSTSANAPQKANQVIDNPAQVQSSNSSTKLIAYAQDEARGLPGTRPPESRCVTSIDCPEGIVKINDRVIYFTDADGDGFFEKNSAFVADDVNATAKSNGTDLQVGNLVNLWVFPSTLTNDTQPYLVRSVKRGRRLGQYEALANCNH